MLDKMKRKHDDADADDANISNGEFLSKKNRKFIEYYTLIGKKYGPNHNELLVDPNYYGNSLFELVNDPKPLMDDQDCSKAFIDSLIQFSNSVRADDDDSDEDDNADNADNISDAENDEGDNISDTEKILVLLKQLYQISHDDDVNYKECYNNITNFVCNTKDYPLCHNIPFIIGPLPEILYIIAMSEGCTSARIVSYVLKTMDCPIDIEIDLMTQWAEISDETLRYACICSIQQIKQTLFWQNCWDARKSFTRLNISLETTHVVGSDFPISGFRG